MLPPDFQASTGTIVRQTRGQAYTWECWLDMIAWASRDPVDAVVIVGDVVDGKQPKSHASELCLPLVVDQEDASEATLTPLLSAAKCPVYFIKGTFYHDDEAGRSVDNVAKSLKATIYEGLGSGTYAKSVLDLNVDGVICDFSHGISVSGGLYRAVAIDREVLWSVLAAKMNETPNADVIVRGHAHYFTHIEGTTKHGMILPAWQLQTDFMRKNSRYRMIPDLGAAKIVIDADAKKRGDDPCQIRKRIYKLPKPNVTYLYPLQTSGKK